MNKNSTIYKVVAKCGKITFELFTNTIDFFVGKDDLYIDPNCLKGVVALEDYFPIISEEFMAVDNEELPALDEIFEEQSPFVFNRSWKSLLLFIYGIELVDNTNKFPKTSKILKKIPGMSAAMFSVLKAGSSIPEHEGLYKGVYRVLLGIVVPEKDGRTCYLEIEGVKKTFEEGKLIVFDDTYKHSSHNNTDSDRVVLFIDIVRKLPFPLNLVNRALFCISSHSPYIEETISKSKKWGNNVSKRIKVRF